MRQESIDFRHLLERLLPLGELAAGDRLTVQRALHSGMRREIENAAYFALRQLEQAGALRRVPAEQNGEGPVVKFESRDRLDVFTLRLPAPEARGPWRVYSRASLPPQAQAGVEQVRHLLRVDDLARLSDPRGVSPRAALAEALQQAGRALVGATSVRLVTPGSPDGAPGGAFDAAQAAAVTASPSEVWYCADAAEAAELSALAAGTGFRSVVLAGIAGPEDVALGHLEILSERPDAFRADDLALVALLADYSGSVLERAERIERLMFIDPLTSAYNRQYFDLQLQNEMARAQREGASFALCIVDIDDFKGFNTEFGYQAGNEVLQQVAHALRRAVRPFDTVARWGGEEFAVLLTAPILAPDVFAVSERLRTMVEKQAVTLEGLDRRSHRVGVTVSIGVGMFPDHAGTVEDLWRAANAALLVAKRPPKNQVVFFGASGGASPAANG